jgi:hypothetical protein
MRSPLVRLGMVVAGLVTLLGATTPPAHADLLATIVFEATAHVGPGLGYPCTTAGAGPFGFDTDYLCLTTFPADIGIVGLPLPGSTSHPENVVPNQHVTFHDNPNVVAFGSTLCIGFGFSAGKLNTVEAPSCTFGGTGTVTGHCGLAGGQVTGAGTLGTQAFVFDLHFNAFGPDILITGHFSIDGQNGKAIGTAVAIAPTPFFTPGESCFDLTAGTFELLGVVNGYATTLGLRDADSSTVSRSSGTCTTTTAMSSRASPLWNAITSSSTRVTRSEALPSKEATIDCSRSSP